MAWRAWQLKWTTCIVLCMIEIGIIVALAVLDSLSKTNDGFVAIRQTFAVSFADWHSTLKGGFLWTTIPTLLMSLFALCWAALVTAYADEMPFRELQSQNGEKLEKTVLLDYRQYTAFNNWVKAFKNGHTLLGFCMMLVLVDTIILVPFAAHLFQVIAPNFERLADFPLKSEYIDNNMNSSVDYEPILATVSAVKVFGGNWPQWTDGIHAIPAFELPDSTQNSLNTTQLRPNVTAYFAELDCQQANNFSITRDSDGEDKATLQVEIEDRGCQVSLKGGVGGGSDIYFKPESIIDCSESAGFSRVAVFGGSYSRTETYLLKNLVVISCIPRYYQINGTAITSLDLRSMSFSRGPNAALEVRPANWRVFEQTMFSLSNVGNNESPDFTSQFGRLVVELARKQNPNALLAPSVLTASMSSAFSSVFAVLAATRLFQQISPPGIAAGSISISETRLSLVTWSAYPSIAIIVVLAVLTVCLAITVHKLPPVVTEEPRGMLTAANVLHSSNLEVLIREAHDEQGSPCDLYAWLKRNYQLGWERCRLTEDGAVSVERLLPKPRD
ncbi:hypothetical protein Q7P37_001833 [Cladosporium fusiforme]